MRFFLLVNGKKQASNRVKRLATRPKRLRIRAKHGLTHSSLGRKNNRKPKAKTGRAWEKAELKAKNSPRMGKDHVHLRQQMAARPKRLAHCA